MTTTTSNSAKQAGQALRNKAARTASHPLLVWLERFGFVIRGLIYVVIGLLALQLAAGAGGATATPTSAITLIGRQPAGKVMLTLVAVGLAGYSLWGFVRAIFDPLGRGADAKGLLARAGYLFSGLSYGALLIPTVLFLMNKPGTTTAGGVPPSLLSGPLGKWLTVAIGLFWIAAGVGQLITAYKARFTRDLDKSKMSADEVEAAIWLGRIGYAARGIVFWLIGVIGLQAALATGRPQPLGYDAALAALAHGPYGAILLGAVAVGLVVFGAYSLMCARWNKMGARRAA